MRLSRQFQPAYLFIYFLRKYFARTKRTKAQNKTTFTLLEVCAREKLLSLLFSVCLILFCWLMFACECFYAREIFSEKK